ncbi:MAG: vWA domain-containing protein, partial [Thermodesulfovibrionales bacterium]
IAVLSFGDRVKTLIPFTDNTKSNRHKINSAIDKVTSKEFSTHIHLAVKEAYELLKETSGVIILMSDGKLTLGDKEKDERATKELLDMLPDISKAKIKVHTIPFTEESDIALLERIAKDTGGFSKLAKTDQDIHIIFSSIFEKIKSPDTIPLKDNKFSIDTDIKEVILIITKKTGTKTTLISPSKATFTSNKTSKDMVWHTTDVFDMITITSPEAGNWQVNLSTTEGNKVYVLTNLRLKSSFDKNFVHKGETLRIDAWLEKDGATITERDVLDKISFVIESKDPKQTIHSAKMTPDVNEAGSPNNNGKYIADFTAHITGDYLLKIVAEGSTFKREKTFEFKVIEPPPPAAPKQEAVTAKQPKSADTKKTDEWNEALMIFGIVNGGLIAVLLIYFLGRKLIKRLRLSSKKVKK